MKKSRKLTLMTVAMAEKIRKMEVYKGQRPYDSKHAYELGDKMKDGRFLTGQVAICHEEDNPKKSTLLDGQHCIGGCIKSKSPFDCLYYEFVVERKDSILRQSFTPSNRHLAFAPSQASVQTYLFPTTTPSAQPYKKAV